MTVDANIPDVSMDRVLGRTREVGGCLEWAGHTSLGKWPQIRVEGKLYPVRRLVWQLVRGATRSDLWITNKCNNPLCVNPDHLIAHTRGKAMTGNTRPAAHRAKIAAAKRAKSALTMEMVREIRSSDDSNPDLAARYGISASYVSHLRNTPALWKDYSSPFAGLGGL